MSKVLKVIADILLILFILAAAAIFVPPLFGVTTAVATPQVTTNMDQGKVAYGKRVPLEELVPGDSIIYSGDDYALLCGVEDVDLSTGVVTVYVEDTTQQIQFHNTAAKTLFTIPLIGYMSIALQTFEGRIILGLIAALIVILFIVSEVWGNKEKADREYELEEEEDDDEYFRGLAKNSARGERDGQSGRGNYRPAPTQPLNNETDVFAAADAGIGGLAAAGAVKAAEESVMDQETTKIELDSAALVYEEEENDPEEERKFWQTKEESDVMLQEIAEAKKLEEAEAQARSDRDDKEAEERERKAEERKAEREERKAEKEAKREERKAEKEAEREERKAEKEAEREERKAEKEAEREERKAEKEAEKEKKLEENEEKKSGMLKPEGEDFSDIDDSKMAEMETALETALVHAGENDHVDHSRIAAAPEEADVPGEAEETPDEIELAIPVRSLEEILQDAYSNGEDPHIRKDSATGITLVDFSETFAG